MDVVITFLTVIKIHRQGLCNKTQTDKKKGITNLLQILHATQAFILKTQILRENCFYV